MFSTDMVVNSYNDIDCAEKDLESSRELSESCEARDLSTLQAGQSTTDVSVYYQLSERELKHYFKTNYF